MDILSFFTRVSIYRDKLKVVFYLLQWYSLYALIIRTFIFILFTYLFHNLEMARNEKKKFKLYVLKYIISHKKYFDFTAVPYQNVC